MPGPEPTVGTARATWSGGEGLLQEGDSLRDGCFGGEGVVKGVDHHEVVDDALIPHRGGRNPCLAELGRVCLALVSQHVGLGGDVIRA